MILQFQMLKSNWIEIFRDGPILNLHLWYRLFTNDINIEHEYQIRIVYNSRLLWGIRPVNKNMIRESFLFVWKVKVMHPVIQDSTSHTFSWHYYILSTLVCPYSSRAPGHFWVNSTKIYIHNIHSREGQFVIEYIGKTDRIIYFECSLRLGLHYDYIHNKTKMVSNGRSRSCVNGDTNWSVNYRFDWTTICTMYGCTHPFHYVK